MKRMGDFLKGMGVWGLRPQRVQGSALAFLPADVSALVALPHLAKAHKALGPFFRLKVDKLPSIPRFYCI
jgi:hypothetical protein